MIGANSLTAIYQSSPFSTFSACCTLLAEVSCHSKRCNCCPAAAPLLHLQNGHYYTDSMQRFLDMLTKRMYGSSSSSAFGSIDNHDAGVSQALTLLGISKEDLELLRAKKKQVRCPQPRQQLNESRSSSWVRTPLWIYSHVMQCDPSQVRVPGCVQSLTQAAAQQHLARKH